MKHFSIWCNFATGVDLCSTTLKKSLTDFLHSNFPFNNAVYVPEDCNTDLTAFGITAKSEVPAEYVRVFSLVVRVTDDTDSSYKTDLYFKVYLLGTHSNCMWYEDSALREQKKTYPVFHTDRTDFCVSGGTVYFCTDCGHKVVRTHNPNVAMGFKQSMYFPKYVKEFFAVLPEVKPVGECLWSKKSDGSAVSLVHMGYHCSEQNFKFCPCCGKRVIFA